LYLNGAVGGGPERAMKAFSLINTGREAKSMKREYVQYSNKKKARKKRQSTRRARRPLRGASSFGESEKARRAQSGKKIRSTVHTSLGKDKVPRWGGEGGGTKTVGTNSKKNESLFFQKTETPQDQGRGRKSHVAVVCNGREDPDFATRAAGGETVLNGIRGVRKKKKKKRATKWGCCRNVTFGDKTERRKSQGMKVLCVPSAMGSPMEVVRGNHGQPTQTTFPAPLTCPPPVTRDQAIEEEGKGDPKKRIQRGKLLIKVSTEGKPSIMRDSR